METKKTSTAWMTIAQKMDQAQIDVSADGENAIIFNTTTNTIQYFNGTEFVDFGGGGGGGYTMERIEYEALTQSQQVDFPTLGFSTNSPIYMMFNFRLQGNVGETRDIQVQLADLVGSYDYNFNNIYELNSSEQKYSNTWVVDGSIVSAQSTNLLQVSTRQGLALFVFDSIVFWQYNLVSV